MRGLTALHRIIISRHRGTMKPTPSSTAILFLSSWWFLGFFQSDPGGVTRALYYLFFIILNHEAWKWDWSRAALLGSRCLHDRYRPTEPLDDVPTSGGVSLETVFKADLGRCCQSLINVITSILWIYWWQKSQMCLIIKRELAGVCCGVGCRFTWSSHVLHPWWRLRISLFCPSLSISAPLLKIVAERLSPLTRPASSGSNASREFSRAAFLLPGDWFLSNK